MKVLDASVVLKWFLKEGDSEEAIDAILDLNADIIVATKSLIEEAIKIAYSKGISIYDASYIALAKSLGYSFITADVKLYNAIKNMHIAELL